MIKCSIMFTHCNRPKSRRVAERSWAAQNKSNIYIYIYIISLLYICCIRLHYYSIYIYIYSYYIYIYTYYIYTKFVIKMDASETFFWDGKNMKEPWFMIVIKVGGILSLGMLVISPTEAASGEVQRLGELRVWVDATLSQGQDVLVWYRQ